MLAVPVALCAEFTARADLVRVSILLAAPARHIRYDAAAPLCLHRAVQCVLHSLSSSTALASAFNAFVLLRAALLTSAWQAWR